MTAIVQRQPSPCLIRPRLEWVEGGTLIITAVFPFDPLPVQAPTFKQAEADYFKQRFDEAQKQLGHGFESRSVSWVSPAKALNNLAESEQVDLIVIGSTHGGKLGRVMPGAEHGLQWRRIDDQRRPRARPGVGSF